MSIGSPGQTIKKSPSVVARRRASINFSNHDQKIHGGCIGRSSSGSPSSIPSSSSSHGIPDGIPGLPESNTILSLFVKGNPFHFMTNTSSNSNGNGDDAHTTVESPMKDSSKSDHVTSATIATPGTYGAKKSGLSSTSTSSSTRHTSSTSSHATSTPQPSQPQTPKIGEKTGGFWALLSCDGDSSKGGSSVSRSAQKENQDYMVVTQVAFNGLSKYVSKYLHMMYLLPTVAPEIFKCLCQLFDYYLLSVFHGFIPSDEKNKFLAKPTKMTTPAPDQTLNYEGLHTYIENTLNEVQYRRRS